MFGEIKIKIFLLRPGYHFFFEELQACEKWLA